MSPMARNASASTVRHQSTSTMGSVTGQRSHPIYAYTESSDFSTAVSAGNDEEAAFHRMHLAALVAAIQCNSTSSLPHSSSKVSKAVTMDLVDAAVAARDVESYDKILILMRHGEAQHNAFEKKWVQEGNDPDTVEDDENYPLDPLLTGKV